MRYISFIAPLRVKDVLKAFSGKAREKYHNFHMKLLFVNVVHVLVV